MSSCVPFCRHVFQIENCTAPSGLLGSPRARRGSCKEPLAAMADGTMSSKFMKSAFVGLAVNATHVRKLWLLCQIAGLFGECLGGISLGFAYLSQSSAAHVLLESTWSFRVTGLNQNADTVRRLEYTHIHTYIYIYICIYKYVECVCPLQIESLKGCMSAPRPWLELFLTTLHLNILLV